MLPFAVIWSLLSASPTTPIPFPLQGNKCSSLTAAELEAATGSKPGPSQEMDMDAGKGARMKGCMWSMPPMGQVVLGTGPAPAGLSLQQLMGSNPGVDAIKKQGYTEEKKEIGGAFCSGYSPPANIKEGMFLSTCGMILKGTIVSINFMSPKKKLSLDQTKALLDKAAARLH